MAANQEQEQRRRLLDVASRFPLPSGCRFSYGTAGFRADGATMAPAVCRAGILAALRSVKLAGAAVGIVITASHNPIEDNGVKIADPDGGMMAQHWEPFADALASNSILRAYMYTDSTALGQNSTFMSQIYIHCH